MDQPTTTQVVAPVGYGSPLVDLVQTSDLAVVGRPQPSRAKESEGGLRSDTICFLSAPPDCPCLRDKPYCGLPDWLSIARPGVCEIGFLYSPLTARPSGRLLLAPDYRHHETLTEPFNLPITGFMSRFIYLNASRPRRRRSRFK